MSEVINFSNWKIVPVEGKPIGEWKVEIPKEEVPLVIRYLENHLYWFITEAVPFLIRRFQ